MYQRLICLFLLLLPAVLGACPSQSLVQVTGKVNGFVDVPLDCSSFTWNITYPDFPSEDGEPFAFVVQIAPVSNENSALGNLVISGQTTFNGPSQVFATVTGNRNSPNVATSNGATYATDIGGDNTYGKVFRLKALTLQFTYTQPLSGATGYILLFKISDQIVGQDLDGDGFIYPNEDCCDTHRACKKPSLVNIGAFNVPNNGVNDAGSGSSCTNYLDIGEETQCQPTVCYGASCASEDLVKAINLCKFVTEESRQWGVIDHRLSRASGSPLEFPCIFQYSVLTSYTGNNNNASYYQKGETFALLTSGDATPTGSSDTECTSRSLVPSAFLDAYGGYLYDNSNGCGRRNPDDNNVFDSVNLVVKLRAPTNANSFSFLIKFLSSEYPQYVCTPYNDFFLALLFRSSDPQNLTPVDKNIAYYVTSDNKRIPLSINLEVFFWVCKPGYSSNAQPPRDVGASCNMGLSSQLDGTTYEGKAGTAELRNVIPVYPGEVFEIYFMIFDVGDTIYDSAVILDDFRWSTTSTNGGGLSIEDPCPLSNKPTPGICGCDIPDVDTDGDGVMDCIDSCVNDVNKFNDEGTCGCGVKDLYYGGGESVCSITSDSNCCAGQNSGYLGGTINWSPQTANTRAREVQFSAEAFFDDDFWCYLSPTNIFVKCSQSSAYAASSRSAKVGETIPALEINYGVTPSTICSTNGFSQTITSASASRFGSWIAGTGYHYFSYTGVTTNRVTYTFSPPADGVYYIQIEVPSLDSSLSTSPLIIEINSGSNQTILPYKPVGPSGFRTLGFFTFSTSSLNTVIIRASNVSPLPSNGDFVIATSLSFTSYNPDADLFTGTFSSLDFAVYVPPGRGITVDAVSSCEVDIYASQDATITSSTVLSSLPIRDVQVGDAKVRISSSTGSTFAFRIITSSSSCSVTYRVSRIVPMTLVEAHTTEKLVVGRATFTNHYASNSCGSGGVTWTASFEGLARSKGYGTATTFDTSSYRLEERISFNSQVRASPQFALPSIIVRTQGDSTDFPFGINRVNPSDVQIRSGLATEFSALLYVEDSINVVPFPSSASIQGSITSRNLALRTSSVGLGYSTVTLVATDSVTGTTTPFDVLLKIVSSSSNNRPTLSILSSAKVNCPSTVTVTATDLDNDSMDIYWRPSFPYTATTTVTTPTASTRRVSFSFTPTSQEVFYVSFTATDGKQDGFGYGLLTLSPTVRSCPNACSGQGTCNCDDTCTCNTRYLPPSCSTYENSAPNITTTLLTMDEDTVLTGTLSFTDSHNDAVSFSLDPTSIPASISVSLQSNGKYTITPNANYFNFNNNAVVRTDQIRVTVTETSTQNLLSSTSLITIRVNNIQDAPVITANYTTTVLEDCTLFTGTVSATDPDNDALTYSFSSSTLGTFSPTGNIFSYVCGSNLNGKDSLTFTVSDGVRSTQGFITINITPVNDRPISQNLNVTTNEDVFIDITLLGSDVDNTVLFGIFQNPGRGTLSQISTSVYRYTPSANFNGVDTFRYVARENAASPQDSIPSTVTVNVIAVNDLPVPGTNTFSMNEDTTLNFTLSATDVDTPTINLRYSFVSVNPSDSRVLLNNITGAVSLTPPANYFGTVDLSFQVTDQIGSPVNGVAKITVSNVNDPPSFSIPTEIVVNEDSPSYSASFLQNVSFGLGGETGSISAVTLSFVNSSFSSLFSSNPSVSTSGILTFTFRANAFGSANFTIRIQDNGGTSNGGINTSPTLNFTITARPVNDPPTFTPLSVTTNEDTNIVGAIFANNINPGPNESNQVVSFNVTSHTCGSLLEGNPILYSTGRMDAVLKPNSNGKCTVNFVCFDNGGTSFGGVDFRNGSFSLTVTAVNDPPFFEVIQDTFIVNEDTTGTISFLYARNIAAGSPDEKDSLAFVLSSFPSGTLFSTLPTISTSGNLTFVLNPNRYGTATFTVQLRETPSNGFFANVTGFLNITVLPINDVPTFSLPTTTAIKISEDAGVLQSFPAATSMNAGPFEDDQTLGFYLSYDCYEELFSVSPYINIIGTNAFLEFLPADNRYLNGSCTFYLTLTDYESINSNSTTRNLTLEVSNLNDPPTFDIAYLFLEFTRDPLAPIPYSQIWAINISPGPFETEAVSFNLIAASFNTAGLFSISPNITSTGLLNFTIAQGKFGYAEFNVRLFDAFGSSSTIAILRINVQFNSSSILDYIIVKAPVIVDEDSGTTSISDFITNIAVNNANNAKELIISTSVVVGSTLFTSTGAPVITANSNFVDGMGGTANLTFTLAPNAFGNATISVTFRIPSLGDAYTKSFLIIVIPINDEPFFNTIADITRNEDSGIFTSTNYVTGIVAGPGGEGVLDSQTKTINVRNCTNLSYFSVVPTVTLLTTSVARLTFTLRADEFGSTQCFIVVTDSFGLSFSRSFNITINPINDAPNFSIPGSLTVLEDASSPVIRTAFASNIIKGPSNENYQILNFTVTPSNPSLFSILPIINNVTGDLTFTLAKDVSGSSTMSVVLSDGESANSIRSRSFPLTVTEVNDPPSFNLSSVNITDYEDIGSVSIPNFVISFSPGPALEAKQTLTWSISATNSALFSALPVIDSSGTLTYTVKPDVSGISIFNVTLIDSGGVANGGVDRSWQTVTYNLLFVNDEPTFSPGSPITLNEDTPVSFVWATSISKGDPLESSQVITFTTSDYDTSLISQCSISSSTGIINVVPVANAFGTTTITVTLTDNLNSSFSVNTTISVVPVNDPPTFSLSTTSVDMIEDELTVTFSNIVQDVNLGPINEVNDVATFTVTIVSSTSSSLLSITPELNLTSGDLTVYANPNEFGTAIISFVLFDGFDNSQSKNLTIVVLPKNDPPFFTLPSNLLFVNEDSGPFSLTLFTSVTAGPSNEANQVLTFILTDITTSTGSNNSFFSIIPTVTSSGTLQFNTIQDVNGQFSFNATLFDNGGTLYGGEDKSITVSATVIVSPVNDPPVAVADTYTTPEDTMILCNVTVNDIDVENDTVYISSVTQPLNGKVTIYDAEKKLISYVPNLNFFGVDTFTYIATDLITATSLSNSITVTINVTPVNDPPVSIASSFNVNEDTTYSVSIPTILLVNDPDDTTFSYTVSPSPSKGTVNINTGKNTFSYIPNSNYCGSDSFSYVAKDSFNVPTSSTLITITVNCVADSPVAPDVYVTMPENTNVRNENIGITVTATDADVDEMNLRYKCTSGPSRGVTQLSSTNYYPLSNIIYYTPKAWKNGVDTINCFVEDSTGLVDNFIIYINVTGPSNHEPFILDPYLQINSFEDVSASGVVKGDDWDETPVIYLVHNTSNPSLASVTFNSSNNGMFTVTPSPNRNGLFSFHWVVSDGSLQSITSGKVDINFNPVNDAPVAQDVTVTVTEEVPSKGKVVVSDVDLTTNTDQLFYRFITSPTKGTVVWTNDAASPEFTYTGFKDLTGSDSFTYRVFDLANSASEIKTVTINIVNVNDPPKANGASLSSNEDTALFINLVNLVVDVDTPSSQYVFSVKTGFAPRFGTLVFNGKTGYNYIPRANFNGNDSFVYRVSDGQFTDEAKVTISVLPVNDAPAASRDVWTLPNNGYYTDIIRALDIDGDRMNYTIVTQPQKGVLSVDPIIGYPLVTYTANPSDPNFESTDYFEFMSNDGKVNSNVARVDIFIIKSNNTRPICFSNNFTVLEGYSLTQVFKGEDKEGATLNYFILNQPTFGTAKDVSGKPGEFVYTPDPFYYGQDSFSFRVKDQFYFSTPCTITITVIPVNDPPSIPALTATTEEDTPVSIDLVATDADGDFVTFAIFTQGKLGNSTISGEKLTYTPSLNRNGVDVIYYVANDGVTNSAQQTITITILPVNDPPVAINGFFSFNEDTVLNGFVRANDVDSNLTYSINTAYRDYSGTLNINSDGSFTYTPNLNYNGNDYFLFFADDGQYRSSGRVDLTINPVQDPPVALPKQISVLEDSSITFSGEASDVDVGDILTYTINTGVTVPGAKIESASPSTFKYTPPPNYNGKDSFTFLAYDGKQFSFNPATITITVIPVNDAPIADDNIYSVQIGSSILITVEGSDVDNTLDELSLILIDNNGTYGKAERVISPPRSFVYQAYPNTLGGRDFIRVQLFDGKLAGDATIEIVVTITPPRPPRVVNLNYFKKEDEIFIGKLSQSVKTKNAEITKFFITQIPSNGGVLTTINDVIMSTSPGFNNLSDSKGDFKFKPNLNFNGVVSFRFKAVDANGGVSDVAVVTITYLPINDAPEAIDGSIVGKEDLPLSIQLRGKDVDSNVITYSLSSTNQLQGHTYQLNSITGILSFTPLENFNGNLTFTFAVSDGSLRSSPGTVVITILPVNDPPTGQDYQFNVFEDTLLIAKVISTDIDGDSLTYSSNDLTPNLGKLTFLSDGSFTYLPELNQVDSVSFTFITSDGFLTSENTVYISITPVNDPPIANNLEFVTNEDTEICGKLTGSDIEDSSVQFLEGVKILISHSSQFYLLLDGTFCYTPENDFAGFDYFSYLVYDTEGGFSVEANVTIQVLSVYDPPQATPISIVVYEDSFVDATLFGMSPDHLSLNYIISKAPSLGVMNITDNRITYTPYPDVNGVDLAYFSVGDGKIDTIASISITIVPVNDPPIAKDISLPAKHLSPVTQKFDAFDIDGDSLSFEIVTKPVFGSVSVKGTSFTYVYNTEVSSNLDSFTYKAYDATNYSNIATVTFNLTRNDVDRDNTNVSNNKGSNMVVGAAVGSISAFAVAALSYLAYKKFQQYQESQALLREVKNQSDFQENPLYQTLSTDMSNPLYEAPDLDTDGPRRMDIGEPITV